MTPELTPFADGEGYREYAWAGLSDPMIDALCSAATRTVAHPGTIHALRRRGLVISEELLLTERGRELVEWARATGRITREVG